ncbi:hypothetical protein RFI_07335 [Reticulomyxa filosa]|uniref:Uncharacterized protein n=1 Tax=Reticulomyxa filosa TaxID=46433 RepID=X6NWW9_RETFI|nr:hypothetical protein RFI_07335 [Reticulomyxa filosa]|eukprot:ETO29787.1 hypothetical protein RFI_07335 [Reticulomyxa filosa]
MESKCSRKRTRKSAEHTHTIDEAEPPRKKRKTSTKKLDNTKHSTAAYFPRSRRTDLLRDDPAASGFLFIFYFLIVLFFLNRVQNTRGGEKKKQHKPFFFFLAVTWCKTLSCATNQKQCCSFLLCQQKKKRIENKSDEVEILSNGKTSDEKEDKIPWRQPQKRSLVKENIFDLKHYPLRYHQKELIPKEQIDLFEDSLAGNYVSEDPLYQDKDGNSIIIFTSQWWCVQIWGLIARPGCPVYVHINPAYVSWCRKHNIQVQEYGPAAHDEFFAWSESIEATDKNCNSDNTHEMYVSSDCRNLWVLGMVVSINEWITVRFNLANVIVEMQFCHDDPRLRIHPRHAHNIIMNLSIVPITVDTKKTVEVYDEASDQVYYFDPNSTCPNEMWAPALAECSSSDPNFWSFSSQSPNTRDLHCLPMLKDCASPCPPILQPFLPEDLKTHWEQHFKNKNKNKKKKK